MTPAQRHRQATFERAADDYGHVVCHFAAEGGCRGRLQAAHIIAAKVLRRVYSESQILWRQGERRAILDTELEEILADGRNGVVACERHHNLHEGPVLHCQPPPVFHEFTADHGLEWLFDNARSAA